MRIKYGIGVDKYDGHMYSSISKARLALESTHTRLDTALETNRRLEQGREETGRKDGDSRGGQGQGQGQGGENASRGQN